MSTSTDQGNSVLGKRGSAQRSSNGLDDNVFYDGVENKIKKITHRSESKMVLVAAPINPRTPQKPHAGPTSTNSEGGSAGPSNCCEEEASGVQGSQLCDAGSVHRHGAPNKWKDRGAAVLQVKVDLEKEHGKYILEVSRVEGSTNEVVRANQMVESAATLLLQAQILRDMAEKLSAQYRESLQSIFGNSAPEF